MPTTVPAGSREFAGCRRAVLMAGGKGTRLAPFTSVLPKPLMPLGDEPIISLLLRQLARDGVEDVTLAVGYLAELIETYCGDGSSFGLNIDYSREGTPLGTVGPLTKMADRLDETFLMMNGDLLTTLDFNLLAESHRQSGALLTLSVIERDIQFEFGVLEVNSAGAASTIKAMHEKPTISRWVSMGAYVVEPEALEYVPEGRPFDLPDLVQALLDDGRTVGAYEFDGYWLDIGRHADYEQALSDFEENRTEFVRSAAPRSAA